MCCGIFFSSFICFWFFDICVFFVFNRGFDYFYGSYSLDTNVLTKTQSIDVQDTDPSLIVDDEAEYHDFWENDEPLTDAGLTDSNTQYTDKMVHILNAKARKDSPFFTFLSFQGPSQYKESNYKFDHSLSTKCSQYVSSDNEDRHYTCEYMLHLDEQFGKILSQLKAEDMWQNTLIVVTSDNGGSLAEGSCNYPLRGGKGSFYEGNVRSLALISGGAVATSSNIQGGNELPGLMSNVDWLPTVLAFANIMPKHWTKMSKIDGYNLYDYILQTTKGSSGSSVAPVRDHILLDLEMFGTEIYAKESTNRQRQWAWTDDEVYNHRMTGLTMTGLTMVFYDKEGALFKYFVSNRDDEVTDEDMTYDYNWCFETAENKFDYSEYSVGQLRPFSGLFALSSDVSEQNNLLRSISTDDFSVLKEIIQEKADYYISSDNSELSKYVYDAFDCFYKANNILTYPARQDGKWTQSFEDSTSYYSYLQAQCGFSQDHPMLELHSRPFGQVSIQDNSVMTHTMNERVPRLNSVQSTKSTDSTKRFQSSNPITKSAIESVVQVTDKNTLMDNDNVYSSCAGLLDGVYYIQIDLDSTKPIVKAQCSNGYMLIDYSSDNDWKEYFSSWIQFHWQVASPFKVEYFGTFSCFVVELRKFFSHRETFFVSCF